MSTLQLIEYAAVAFNITYVVLAWYQKKACWIFGAIGSALSVYYFMHEDIRLYSEACLYVFYVGIAVYGWSVWSRPDSRPISELKASSHFILILVGSVGAYLLSMLWVAYTDAARPLADSLSTVFGVIATFLTIRKVLSNWIYWIIIDVFSIWLYLSRESEVYAVQMAVFAVLAVIGYMQWKKSPRAQGGETDRASGDRDVSDPELMR